MSGIVAGHTLREISRSLKIEVTTAKSHLLKVFSKTGIHRQVELVRLASSLKLPVGQTQEIG
jgi:DNA-binding CsgD family transcriptional regulator